MSTSSSVDEQIETLFREHGTRLLGYLARRVLPVEEAADLLSETMLTVWRRRDDLPAAPDDVPWAFGVARNVLANHRRSSARRTAATAQLAQVLIDLPVEHADRVEAGLDLRRALQDLPDLDREIVLLSGWDGLTSAEIGLMLDMPNATVRTKLARARHRLRRTLTGGDQDEDPQASVFLRVLA